MPQPRPALRRVRGTAARHAVLVLALAACDRSPVAPARTATAVPALRAASLTSGERMPVEILTFVPCAARGAGEAVALRGSLHVLVHLTASTAGNYQVKTQFQPQGISGRGAVTGDLYRATGATQTHEHSNGPLPIVYTAVNQFQVVGPGPGNDFRVRETVHVTIDAAGRYRVDRASAEVRCR
jgi:hypothetical protein